MLRRRKGPKAARPKVAAPVAAAPIVATPVVAPAKARRRARPGADVPAELRIREPRAHAAAKRADQVVLVTGFEPFGGEPSNPSWEVCEQLPALVAGMRVEKCLVPCEFRRSIEAVAKAIEQHRPSIVLCLGQAGGRAHLTVERVAINIDDASIPDNAGESPIDESIASQGPPAYFATLPVKAIVRGVRAAGIPAELSNTAGTYVCNHLMYGVLHFLAASGISARAGFIHVPYAEGQVLDKPGIAAMSIASMARGVEAALAAAVANAKDIAVPEGATY